jgi:predicted RNA-binding Zn-ribbon protein involved in translation (DUF1610 family)
VLWCGASIFRVAWKGLLQRTANMDSLVALGVGAAYGWSVVVVAVEMLPRVGASTPPPVYFEAAGVVITLVLVGRWIEMRATMRTRIYVAGTEGFIGQVMRETLDFGVDHKSIRNEHRGSEARRVQCVHCKGITEDVKTSPYQCTHCGLNLLVRDHYSRRLAAFQGVSIEAEEPGTAPAPEELFR